MNISKKEKVMLSVLGIIFVGFLYYQFVYLNLAKAVEDKAAEQREIENKYNNAMTIISKMESQRSNVKILNTKIEKEAEAIYPTVSQEHIILEIDKMIKDNGLEGGMEFDLVESDVIDTIKKSDKDKGDLESTMQGTVDEYNDTFGEKKDEQKNTSKESQANDKAKSNETTSTSDSTAKDNKKNKVVKMKGKVKFYGTYQNVVKFVKAIEDHENKICLYAIGMDINNEKWVKGELGIAIYSVPKLKDEISSYLNWSLNNTYGKSEPFQLNQAAGNGIKGTKPTSDFMISVKPTSSELPTVMMGKTDDTLRSTYVYADGKDKQAAEIELSKQGDKYYYKYKAGNTSIPVDYSGDGIEFTPCGDSIVISALSENRSGDNDKSGLKLNIINNTDKLVKVEVSGDDKNDPRVSIDGDSKKISVSQK